MIEVKIVTADDVLNNENSSFLYEKYAEESKGDYLDVANSPSVESYKTLEDLGMLTTIGAYNDGKLIGFLSLITAVMPHYGEKSSTIESFFVLKEFRKYGTAKRMMDLATNSAKENNSVVMFMSAPIGSRLDSVAKYMGFKETNIVFTKKL